MKLKNFLIVVKDIERSRRFYEDLFGLEMLVDNDGNMVMTDGLALQEEKYWKEFLGKEDKVLVIDDFLAKGNALNGLMDILDQAGAELIGCAIAIEKGFQGGGDKLRAEGIRVESLAIIDKMTDDSLEFRQQA